MILEIFKALDNGIEPVFTDDNGQVAVSDGAVGEQWKAIIHMADWRSRSVEGERLKARAKGIWNDKQFAGVETLFEHDPDPTGKTNDMIEKAKERARLDAIEDREFEQVKSAQPVDPLEQTKDVRLPSSSQTREWLAQSEARLENQLQQVQAAKVAHDAAIQRDREAAVADRNRRNFGDSIVRN